MPFRIHFSVSVFGNFVNLSHRISWREAQNTSQFPSRALISSFTSCSHHWWGRGHLGLDYECLVVVDAGHFCWAFSSTSKQNTKAREPPGATQLNQNNEDQYPGETISSPRGRNRLRCDRWVQASFRCDGSRKSSRNFVPLLCFCDNVAHRHLPPTQ